MKTLSGTSLTMKQALENGGQGFDTLAEKAAAARGELEKTDQILRSLKAADAPVTVTVTMNCGGHTYRAEIPVTITNGTEADKNG